MAARIPQDYLDQLLSRVDLVEVIDARIPLRKAGRDYSACCPFHSEKTPSFTVSPSKQFYHCFGCGAHGTAIGFLMAYEHLGFVEAIEELARAVGLEPPRGVSVEPGNQDILIALVEQAEHFFRRQLHEHPARQRALNYLHSRGLDAATIKAFAIGYAPPAWDDLLKALTAQGAALKALVQAGLVIEQDNGDCRDRFRDRILFPIRDRRGRTIAFGGRTLGDATPKYLNSPETPFFHKGRELYGLYEARQRERQLRRLLVVEGYLDVVALVQHGIPYVVATLGTATTTEHLERLFRITRDVVFCFDGDRAGREAAWRALENTLPLLRDDHQVSFLFLPEGEDPDSLVRKEGRERFEQRLVQARPLSDYFFERLGVDLNLHSLDGRARLAERARPLLNKLPDSLYRDMLVQRLAELTGIDPGSITKRLTAVPLSVARPRRDTNLTRTPVRLAIALLLNHPELAQQAGDMQRFRDINVPGLPLLVELVELLQHHPPIRSAAQLLTRYEGTATGQILKRLAEWQPPYANEENADELYRNEFLDTLKQLEKSHDPQKRLLKLATDRELSAEEKEMLRRLGKPPPGERP
jgi:DNA primase